MADTIRVLIVDDSAFMRKIISDLLAGDRDIAVIATARDGLDAVEKCKQLRPDVITLDVEMPRLDGLQCLERLMVECPTPVLMVSSLTQEGAATTVRALELGAVDFIPKPSGSISLDMAKVRDDLINKVKVAARANVRPARRRPDALPVAAARPATPGRGGRRIVCIGCSTGGPGALHEVLPRLPADLGAPVLVVQHMPPGFTRSLAQRLDELSPLRIREAAAGDRFGPGDVLIAPGGSHMTLASPDTIALNQDPPLHGVRPAVDITLSSVVQHFGGDAVGVILTGMGFDGARAMAELHRAGGRTIAEHQSTCVVYGMPRAVVEMGVADVVAPIHAIAERIVEALQR
ncbi:MAG: protein-glutamate methylesterase/protein-glutamine glutaminase [Chloroflexota bacterium]